jgi:hypothetical protein
MLRATLSTLLCLCAFAVGLLTVALAARNRARGAELDSRQRWCEIFSRQNEALRAESAAEEWRLVTSLNELHAEGAELPAEQVER